MYSAVWSTNNWAYGFLLMFVWGALALVLMNLVVSLVIESYLQINQTTLEEQSTVRPPSKPKQPYKHRNVIDSVVVPPFISAPIDSAGHQAIDGFTVGCLGQQPTEIEDEEELRQHEEELKPQVSRKRRMTEQMFSPEFLEVPLALSAALPLQQPIQSSADGS